MVRKRGRKDWNCESRKGKKEREKDGLGYCLARFYSFLGWDLVKRQCPPSFTPFYHLRPLSPSKFIFSTLGGEKGCGRAKRKRRLTEKKEQLSDPLPSKEKCF